jgi:ligand-binding SRPBCC domain-containing protein
MFQRVYVLTRQQHLAMSLEDCWDFFSSPLNLPVITPPWLGFEVEEIAWEKMYPGMILQYFVRPLLGVRMRWVTEITHVQPMSLFVDEQRFGPYRMWHHEHHFKPTPAGVDMTDIVHYAIGYGPLDPLLHETLVRSRLEAIFDFRFETLEKMFGPTGSAPSLESRAPDRA